MRRTLLVAVLAMIGCRASIPSGVYLCSGDDSQCPPGQVCTGTVCVLPASRDAGPIDAPADPRLDGATSDAGLPCDPDEAVDPSGGVFVQEGRTGDGSSASSPIGTLAAAIPLARLDRPHIYLAEGAYADFLDLTSPPAGLVIDGGWRVLGGTWERDCGRGRDATLISPPGPIGMRLVDATFGIELRHLTIETSPPGAAGGSRYALVVQGDGSAVGLFDVHLHARAGEPGTSAAAPAPAPAPACNGIACGTGGAGGGGAAGPDAMTADAFDASGYTPIDGQVGTTGLAGQNGTMGAPSFNTPANCCGLCNGGGWCSTTCNAVTSVPQGRCGCGGQPGGAGQAGHGGGASVGLLVAGTAATVSATWTTIESEDGGAGSAGGMPAPASAPTAGTPSTAQCCTSCRVASACPACSCFLETCTDYSAAAGGPGGDAGPSGGGGGGAGGPSYSVVTMASTSFVADPQTMLRNGTGGAGGGASNAGASGGLLRL